MRLFIVVFLLGAFSLLVPNVSLSITMDDAVNMSLNNDDTIKKNEALVGSQKYAADSAFAGFLPTAGLRYNYSDTDTNKPSIKSKDSSLSVELGINLFNGLADWKNYKLGTKAYDMQKYTNVGNRNDVILNTKSAYIALLKATNELKVAQETLALIESQKKIADVSYNVGQFSKADVLKVDVQLASSQLDVLNAEIAEKLARKKLEKYIGRQITDNEEIKDLNATRIYKIPGMDDLYNMLENRSEMLYAKGGYESAVLTKEKTVSGFLPKVNLGYSYMYYGENMSPFDGRDGNPDTRSDTAGVVSLTATWNLFQGFYDYNTYKSKSMAANATAFGVSDLRKTLRLQLDSIYENYLSAQKRLAVSEVGVKQALENYRVTESLYKNTSATTTDLLDASVSLNKAQMNLSAAKYDIVDAIAQLERVAEADFSN